MYLQQQKLHGLWELTPVLNLDIYSVHYHNQLNVQVNNVTSVYVQFLCQS